MQVNRCCAGVWLLTVLIGLPSVPAAEDAEKPENRPNRKNADGQRKQGQRTRGGDRSRAVAFVNVGQLEQGVRRELDLTPEQQSEIDGAFAAYKAELMAIQQKQHDMRNENKEALQALFEKMKAAREAHDRQALREAKQELIQLTPPIGPSISQLTRKLIDRITSIVPEAQHDKLASIVDESRPQPGVSRYNPKQLAKLAEQAGIDAEKVAAIRALANQGSNNPGTPVSGEPGGKGSGRPQRLRGSAMISQVRELLTPQEFQTLIKAMRDARGVGKRGRPKPENQADRAPAEAP